MSIQCSNDKGKHPLITRSFNNVKIFLKIMLNFIFSKSIYFYKVYKDIVSYNSQKEPLET